MKKYRIKSNVLFHQTMKGKKAEILAFHLESPDIFVFRGDVGELFLALQKNSETGLNIKEMIDHLSGVSKTFKENHEKEETLNEALSYLEEIQFL